MIRQRLLFIATVVAGAVCWTAALPWLTPIDGGGGLSLSTARIGLIGGIVLAAVAGVPALLLGSLASATGGRLTGITAIAFGLMIAAGVAGPIDGWIYHQGAALPGAYLSLMVEMLIWQAGILGMLLIVQRLRDPMTTRRPALAYADHLEIEIAMRRPQLTTWASVGLCTVIGGMLSYWLVRDSDGGQVICGLGVSFLLAGMITQLVLPRSAATGALFAPAIVALIAYAFVPYHFADERAFLAGWYSLSSQSGGPTLAGPALALPVHYASAGVLGAAAGLAWARTMIAPPADEYDDMEEESLADADILLNQSNVNQSNVNQSSVNQSSANDSRPDESSSSTSIHPS